jgi:hypothetical protein
MIAVGQKFAIATAAFATFGMSLALMPAQSSAQRISGTISFKASLLPHGFNSKACQDFRVIAEQPAKPSPAMEVIGKTTGGKMTPSVKGGTVECAYSVEMLQVPSGQVTVKPGGKPLGYKPPTNYRGAFNPVYKTVNGNRCRPTCSFSNVDFVFYSASSLEVGVRHHLSAAPTLARRQT